MNLIRSMIALIIFAVLGFTGWACSTSKSNTIENEVVSGSAAMVSVFFTEKLTIYNQQYESQLLKHTLDGQNVYWQLIKGKGASHGTIIYSLPYTGADWTGESLDSRWAKVASALTGYWAPDIDGPSFDNQTSKNIFYQQIKKESLPAAGIGLSFNGYDVLYIYHRFYAGRFADDYVSDVTNAVAWLKSKNPDVQIGLLGFSLGGFITAQATQEIAPPDLKATVLVSPLLSWPKQNQYLSSLTTLIPDDAKRNDYLDFFEPYTRRFSNIESSQMDIPSYSIPTLIFHDEWDTLVPIEQSDLFKQTNSASVTLLRYFHPTPIDFMTMAKDHSQPGSGMSSENIIPFYLAFLFNHVGTDQSVKFVIYNQASMDLLFNEMSDSLKLGKDILGFQQALGELCKSNFTMWELNQAATPESGPQYLTRKLNAVFSLNESEATICHYLETGHL